MPSAASATDVHETLLKTLHECGLESRLNLTGLSIPASRKDEVRSLVCQHLDNSKLPWSEGIIRVDTGQHDELQEIPVIFIEQVSPSLGTNPEVLARIATGLAKHHRGCRLAIDVESELLGPRKTVAAAYSEFENVVVIPWKMVLEPGEGINDNPAFGHELIHVKQTTEFLTGKRIVNRLKAATVSVSSEDMTPSRSKDFREIEAHLFCIKHYLNSLDTGDWLSTMTSQRAQLTMHLLGTESIFLREHLTSHRELISSSIEMLENGGLIGRVTDNDVEWIVLSGSNSVTKGLMAIQNDTSNVSAHIEAGLRQELNINSQWSKIFGKIAEKLAPAIEAMKKIDEKYSIRALLLWGCEKNPEHYAGLLGKLKPIVMWNNDFAQTISEVKTGLQELKEIATHSLNLPSYSADDLHSFRTADQTWKMKSPESAIREELTTTTPDIDKMLRIICAFDLEDSDLPLQIASCIEEQRPVKDMVLNLHGHSTRILFDKIAAVEPLRAIAFGDLIIKSSADPNCFMLNNLAWAYHEQGMDPRRALELAESAEKVFRENNPKSTPLPESIQDTVLTCREDFTKFQQRTSGDSV